MLHDPVKEFSTRVEGLDNRPPRDNASSELIWIGEYFTEYSNQTSDLKGQWTRFRGADFENIIRFPDRYNDAKIFKLTTNYRSSPEILELANELDPAVHFAYGLGGPVAPLFDAIGRTNDLRLFDAEEVAQVAETAP